MPIKDKSKYPPNWKSEIRPRILARDGNMCKTCRVPNGEVILRGRWDGKEVWQDDDGNIFDLSDGTHLGDDYVGEVCQKESDGAVKIVLTIAHLDHNTENNADENLAALCQLHHLRHDKDFHRKNARETWDKKTGQQKLL